MLMFLVDVVCYLNHLLKWRRGLLVSFELVFFLGLALLESFGFETALACCPSRRSGDDVVFERVYGSDDVVC